MTTTIIARVDARAGELGPSDAEIYRRAELPVGLLSHALDLGIPVPLSLPLELQISMSNSGTRPAGGIFMPMFRGRRAHVQAARLKARRLDCCRDLNPRSASAFKCATASATIATGATAMARTGDLNPDHVTAYLLTTRIDMERMVDAFPGDIPDGITTALCDLEAAIARAPCHGLDGVATKLRLLHWALVQNQTLLFGWELDLLHICLAQLETRQ